MQKDIFYLDKLFRKSFNTLLSISNGNIKLLQFMDDYNSRILLSNFEQNDILNIFNSMGPMTFLNNISNEIIIERNNEKEISAKLQSISDNKKIWDNVLLGLCPPKKELNMEYEWQGQFMCCGTIMQILPDTSQAICNTCSAIVTIVGVSFRPSNNLDTVVENNKNHRTTYEYLRYLNGWLDKLQGIENYDISPADIEKIKKWILREYDEININSFGLRDIQWILSQCHLSSKLSNHIPKLLSLLGNVRPRQLQHQTIQIIIDDFSRLMEIYNTLPLKLGNKPYYPFFIKKVIINRFGDHNSPISPELLENFSIQEIENVRKMASFIEPQEKETDVKNDNIYKMIIDRLKI